MHRVSWALSLALLRAGKSMLAKMAMMEITTSNSINVNAIRVCGHAARPLRWHPIGIGDAISLENYVQDHQKKLIEAKRIDSGSFGVVRFAA